MVDESWIRELEERARPLRVELPPWGEVLAREAVRAPSRETSGVSRKWIVAAAVAMAAAVVVAAWPRHETQRAADPTSNPVIESATREPGVIGTPSVDGGNVEPPTVESPTVESPLVPVPPTPPVVTPPVVTPPVETADEALVDVSPQDRESLEKVPRVRPTPRRRAPPRVPASEKTVPSVDCSLDPSLCAPKAPSPAAAELPETLAAADIKAGINQIKPHVEACARTHGASSGERVKIKVTILGDTGLVTQASVVDSTLSAELEGCIVDAAYHARFPRFAKQTLGAVFPITMP